MEHKRGNARNQSSMFPGTVDDYISDENPARFIDAYVESLDLSVLGFRHTSLAITGRPPYHPSDLLKLYIYGYLNKIRSSRELEKATHRNVEVMWLIRQLHPDFKTIADFRKENIEALKKVCREFTLLCKRLDLFGGELVAIDGSKFSAVNHNSRSYTKEKLQRLLKEVDEKIALYFTNLEQGDTADGFSGFSATESINSRIASLQNHKAVVEQMLSTLAETGEKQVATTDPDSRMMRTGNRGRDVCYNAQIAVDEKHKLIIAHEVTNEGNDLHQLEPMAESAKEVLGVDHLEVTADKGYYNEMAIKQCEEKKIDCYIPEPEKSQNAGRGLYTDKDFLYDAESDKYICPANEYLSYRFESMKRNKLVRIYETGACRECMLRVNCRSSKRNRRIYRWIHESTIEAMHCRMIEHPEKSQKRKTLVEHPFAVIKHWMNQGYFLLRGIKKVAGEFSMSVLAYNMKRVLSIITVPELIAAVGAIQMRLSFLTFCIKSFFIERDNNLAQLCY